MWRCFKQKVARDSGYCSHNHKLQTHSLQNTLPDCVCMCVCFCIWMFRYLGAYVFMQMDVCVNMCVEAANMSSVGIVVSSVTLGKSLITQPSCFHTYKMGVTVGPTSHNGLGDKMGVILVKAVWCKPQWCPVNASTWHFGLSLKVILCVCMYTVAPLRFHWY